jgi:hypothetical protein
LLLLVQQQQQAALVLQPHALLLLPVLAMVRCHLQLQLLDLHPLLPQGAQHAPVAAW